MEVVAEKLTMRFNDAGKIIEVFSNLDLHVTSGSSVAIVGESGVGKTTLLYVLGGLEQATSGVVRIGQTEIGGFGAQGEELAVFRGKNLGFVFQFHHLLPEFDAIENVAMPLIIRGESRKEAFSRAESLLARVGLSHRLTHRPGTLSGGEQQRVAVARAFAGRPGVVLADEPTGNLDVRTASEVNGMLRQMQKEERTTLIVVTHSLDLARSLDRVVELTPKGLVWRTLEERVDAR